MRYWGKVVTSSENGLVLATLTNIETHDDGRVTFERIDRTVPPERGEMSKDELLGMFLEGLAYPLGAVVGT